MKNFSLLKKLIPFIAILFLYSCGNDSSGGDSSGSDSSSESSEDKYGWTKLVSLDEYTQSVAHMAVKKDDIYVTYYDKYEYSNNGGAKEFQTIMKFDASSAKWEKIGGVAKGFVPFLFGSVGDKLYVLSQVNNYVNEIYQSNDTETSFANLNKDKETKYFSGIYFYTNKGKIILVGQNGSAAHSVNMYDIATSTWTTTEIDIGRSAMFYFAGKGDDLFAFYNGGYLAVSKFDFDESKWTKLSEQPKTIKDGEIKGVTDVKKISGAIDSQGNLYIFCIDKNGNGQLFKYNGETWEEIVGAEGILQVEIPKTDATGRNTINLAIDDKDSIFVAYRTTDDKIKVMRLVEENETTVWESVQTVTPDPSDPNDSSSDIIVSAETLSSDTSGNVELFIKQNGDLVVYYQDALANDKRKVHILTYGKVTK